MSFVHITDTMPDPSLVFAPASASATADLQASNPGDGSASDITALVPVKGSGVPTQIALGDSCITANGVVPGTATQTLHMAPCDDSDSTQLWVIDLTVSNADGNCITLGRAALGVPVCPLYDVPARRRKTLMLWIIQVTLGVCSDVLNSRQSWNTFPVAL